MLQRYRKDLAQTSSSARHYLVGSALMGASFAVAFTLLARYLDLLGYTKTMIGTIQSADSWGKTLVAIPAALVLARRSARGVFVSAAIVAGAGYAVLPWLESFRAVYWCNFVCGLAMTVHYVAIAPFLFRHTGLAERATMFGVAEAVRTLAAVLGAVLAGWFVQLTLTSVGGETRAHAFAISGAGLVSLCAALAYARIDDPTPSMSRGQAMWPVLVRHRGVLTRFAVPQFVIASGAGFCIPFLPLYFKERFAFDAAEWGSLFAGGQVLMTAGFLLTPLALARLGFVRAIVFIELLSIPFFLMLAFTRSAPVAVIAFLMRGALMNSTHPLIKNFMMEATPPGAREMQTGVNATLWGVGWVVGPIAAGRVLDATGDDYGVLMLTTVGLYLAAAVLSWTLLAPIGRRAAEPDTGATGLGQV